MKINRQKMPISLQTKLVHFESDNSTIYHRNNARRPIGKLETRPQTTVQQNPPKI